MQLPTPFGLRLPWHVDYRSKAGLFATGNILFFVTSLLLTRMGFTEAKGQQNKRFNVPGKLLQADSKGSATWPTFDLSLPDNVTVEAGQAAYLPCSIINQGSYIISWSRKNRNFNLLTVGDSRFVQDDRYSTPHGTGPSDWSLRIAQVKQGDGGTYECQIGTAPKSARFVTLHVAAVRTMPSRRNSSSSHGTSLAYWHAIYMFCWALLLEHRIATFQQ